MDCLPGLQILHSKDLVNWTIIGAAVPYALPPVTDVRPEHGNRVWAPSIRHHNGEFYIFWGDPDQGAFMVKAKDPKGPWSEPVLVKAGKGIIVVVNKWDLIKKDTHTMNRFEKEIRQEFSFMPYAPLLFISVKTGQRMMNVLKLAGEVAEQRAMRIPTGQLNAVIADATLMKQPPSDKGKKLKIYYVTQVGVKPPLFSFKVNKRELMHFSYTRYLENKIREAFGFKGTSLRFFIRERKEKER